MLVRLFALLLSVLLMAAGLPNMRSVPWQVVDVPTDSNLLDIAFTEANPDRGWVVGDRGTLLETLDGGASWGARQLQTSNPDYYLASVSFSGNEGWIAGQPKVMLHTENGGDRWSQIPLSEQLPGDPMLVTALGPQSAEMVTSVGAIYRTDDGGRNWKAQVNDAIGVLRNVHRREDGYYLSVSSRGNFYSLYDPNERVWKPFQRDSSRRLQNIGFGPNGKAWKINRGAELALTDDFQSGKWDKTQRPGKTTSFGYLNATYQDENNLWVVGGSALLIHSRDGGRTWEQARKLGNVPANFYSVTFPQRDRGFVLGQKGTLLRYLPQT
jgi:photosystem II stability/assembly factor-like uncharacterized protein